MEEPKKIKVSKMDAARRQLKCAIELWFGEKDAVSIHTLAFAANQIISDICVKKTGSDSLYNSPIVKPGFRKEVIALFNLHGNFFKHADKDPDGIADFPLAMSEAFMLLAIGNLQNLGESLTPTENIFYVWQSLHRPTWLDSQFKFLTNTVPPESLRYVNSLNKWEYFKQGLEAIAHLATTKV